MKKLKLDKTMMAVIALCIIGVMILGYALYSFWSAALSGEEPVARGADAPKVPYVACISIESIVADTPLLLVDLSDATNFPHSATNKVIARALHYQGALSGDQDWNLDLGVVTENDATDGSVTWIHRQCRTRLAQFDEGRSFSEHGLNLKVANGALTHVASNVVLTNTAVFSSGAVMTSPIGTGSPAVGDVVVLLDEIDDTAILTYTICIDYDTE